MDNLLTVNLEAHNPTKNYHRRYRITIGRDLLADWTVTISHGRAGSAGHVTRFASSTPEEAQEIVRTRLFRRLSAPRRIGCDYAVVEVDASANIDTRGWLPQALVARFRTLATTEPLMRYLATDSVTACQKNNPNLLTRSSSNFDLCRLQLTL